MSGQAGSKGVNSIVVMWGDVINLGGDMENQFIGHAKREKLGERENGWFWVGQSNSRSTPSCGLFGKKVMFCDDQKKKD